MSSFSEFSKEANKPHHNVEKVEKNKKQNVDDVAKNRINPKTGNEWEEREPTRNLHEANDISNTRSTRDSERSSVRSQNRNDQVTSRL